MSQDLITIGHGAGGTLTRRLITDLFVRHFANDALNPLDDAATLPALEGPVAFTTDAYVVQPLFFPGGDIGRLAVCGTVNDLVVTGATPRWISAAFVIEEGLPVATLARVAASMAAAAQEAGVAVACGDTKVVRRGEADGLFITTAGIGVYERGRPARAPIALGDKVVINGPFGEHGVAVLLARNEFKFAASLASDCAPLAGLCRVMLDAAPGIKFMRDPTRGGLGGVLNELVAAAGLGVALDETALPVNEDVAAVCEILGLDQLYIANEGKVVAAVGAGEADRLIAAMRAHPLAKNAAVIGEVVAAPRVIMHTAVGGARVIEMPYADQLPRIC